MRVVLHEGMHSVDWTEFSIVYRQGLLPIESRCKQARCQHTTTTRAKETSAPNMHGNTHTHVCRKMPMTMI